MPLVDLLPVPEKQEFWRTYLMNNFRRVADSVAMAVSQRGDKDIEITDTTKGVILRSPNGSRYRITVNNAGVLVVSSA